MAPVSDAAFESLKDRVIRLEQDHAVREETMKGVENRLAKIEVVLSRLTWLLVSAIVGAALTFILSGGANVIGN